MFHKLNVHSGLSPNDIEKFFQPIFDQAEALSVILNDVQSPLIKQVSLPFITVSYKCLTWHNYIYILTITISLHPTHNSTHYLPST